MDEIVWFLCFDVVLCCLFYLQKRQKVKRLEKYIETKLPTECAHGHRSCVHEWGHDCSECRQSKVRKSSEGRKS